MVRDFVKLLNALDVGAYNSFLFFEHSDGPVDFHIHEMAKTVKETIRFCKVKADMAQNSLKKVYLLIIEILQSHRDLVFSLLIEDDLEGACVIVNLEQCPHGLLLLGSHSAHDYDLNKEENY